MEHEHRVVCKHFPNDGHQLHTWPKLSAKSAKQSVIDYDHKAEVNPNYFYAACAPFRVQTRPVVEWEDM